MSNTHTIQKEKGTFYVDYVISDGKCFIIQEYANMVKTSFVCKTRKERCEDLKESDTQIFITI
jgi:hypothetical protein